MSFIKSRWIVILACIILLAIIIGRNLILSKDQKNKELISNWHAPDLQKLKDNEEGRRIRYGYDLISHTGKYFGPSGKIASITNGMNCQNCHISAGAISFGNCFSAVAATYPKFRERSGRVESIEFRINDCLVRSLNGRMIDSTSKEMQAMVAYLKWLGQSVPTGKKPVGAGLEDLPFLSRAADPGKGQLIFSSRCIICHGEKGEGKLHVDSGDFIYPPLWGDHSYNTGAGLLRLSRLASFIKNNMPFGATHDKPQLSNEEAWDVAAYINTQPRPVKIFAGDWPNLAGKPFDFPFGPYKDSFSEQQHRFGPFGAMVRK